MDNHDYLEEGFDASKLRIQDLRKIFLEHDIAFPSNAKKAEYVRIFNEDFAPQRQVIKTRVEANAAAPSSSRGIVDVEVEQSRPRTRSRSPAKSPKKSTAKRSPRKKADDEEEESSATKRDASPSKKRVASGPVPNLEPPKDSEQPKTASPKRRGRKTLSKPVSDDVDASPSKRASKQTPSVMKVDAKSVQKDEEETSPFSDKNVFQSGSPKTTPESWRKKRPHPFDADIEEEEKKNVPQKRRSKKSAVKKEEEEKQNVDSKNEDQKQRKTAVEDENENDSDTQTPGSIMRHFTTFDSPEENDNTKTPNIPKRQTMPATVQQPLQPQQKPAYQDHTFSEKKVNKRLSFMPNFHELNMSNDFKRQLEQDTPKPKSQPQPQQQQKEEPQVHTPVPSAKVHTPTKASPVDTFATEDIAPADDNTTTTNNNDNDIGNVTEQVLQLDSEIDQEEKSSKKKKKSSKKKSKGRPINWFYWCNRVFTLLGLGLFLQTFLWWRQQRIEVGYCNVAAVTDTSSVTLEHGESMFARLLDEMRPGCVPCPQHAFCYPKLQSVCEVDFLKRESWFSLGGVLPVPPTCEPDTEKQRKVEMVVKRAAEVLAQRETDRVCGDLDGETSSAMSQDDLRDELYKMKQDEVSDEQFDDLWEHAVKDLELRDTITVELVRTSYKGYAQPGDTEPEIPVKKKIFQSTVHSSLPFQCKVRRYVFATMARYRQSIVSIAAVILTVFTIKWVSTKQLEERELVNDLTKKTLSTLVAQQKLSDADEKGLTVRYTPSLQLRDNLLPGMEHAKRNKLWNKVEDQVELNTNVRANSQEVHGEIMKVWEWTGADANF